MAKKQVKTVKNDGIEIPTFVNKNYQNQRKKTTNGKKVLLACSIVLSLLAGFVCGSTHVIKNAKIYNENQESGIYTLEIDGQIYEYLY